MNFVIIGWFLEHIILSPVLYINREQVIQTEFLIYTFTM